MVSCGVILKLCSWSRSYDKPTIQGRLTRIVLMLWTVAALGACTTIHYDSPEAAAEAYQLNDPAEQLNRQIFAFNLGLDVALIKPITGVYRYVLPKPARRGVHNILNNLRSPVIFANDLLQGELQQASNTLVRFLINSTAGVLGFSDHATRMGFEFHNEDLGQTLAVWGVPEGPFAMSPIIGPSNPRDSFGRVVELIFDPLNFWSIIMGRYELVVSRTLVRGIDARDRLWALFDELNQTSLDPYSKIRSLYRQRRLLQIENRDYAPRPQQR